MCQSPKERLLQLESIFALGISITGLQSSASLIMDSHMALLTHTVLQSSLPLLAPPEPLICPTSNFSHFVSVNSVFLLYFVCCFFLFCFFTFYLPGHILFFITNAPPLCLSFMKAWI